MNVPMRDKDSENCVCGREIIRWNGGVIWMVKLISEPDKEEQKEG